MRKLSIRAILAIALGALVAGLFSATTPTGATPVAQQTQQESQQGKRAKNPGISFDRMSAREAAAYWTPERMANAKPMPLPAATGDLAEPATARAEQAEPYTVSAPYEAEASEGTMGKRVPRTAGRAFVRMPDGDYYCSGAAINSRSKSLVITAGHCVHPGGTGCGGRSGWATGFAFVPKYRYGKAPYGVWYAKYVTVPRKWCKSTYFPHDQAVLKMRKHGGKKIVRAVGGNGVRINAPFKQRRVQQWGWPADPAYGFTGEVAVGCEGRTRKLQKFTLMKCRTGGGASGGPYLMKKGRRKNVGWQFAVLSRGNPVKHYIISAPFGSQVSSMIRQADRK